MVQYTSDITNHMSVVDDTSYYERRFTCYFVCDWNGHEYHRRLGALKVQYHTWQHPVEARDYIYCCGNYNCKNIVFNFQFISVHGVLLNNLFILLGLLICQVSIGIISLHIYFIDIIDKMNLLE